MAILADQAVFYGRYGQRGTDVRGLHGGLNDEVWYYLFAGNYWRILLLGSR